MEEFYAMPKRLIVPGIFGTVMFGGAIYGSIQAGGTGGLIGAGVLSIPLVLFYVLIYQLVERPIVMVDGSQIRVRTKLGRIRTIDNVENCELIVNPDCVYLRCGNDDDVIVERGLFQERVWQDMLTYLKALPLKGVAK